MSNAKVTLKHENLIPLVARLAKTITEVLPSTGQRKMYPIPRGGVPVAYLLMNFLQGATVVDNPEDADFFVDDILASGATMQRWCDDYPGKAFFVLIDKNDPEQHYKDFWVVFPWENNGDKSDASVTDNVVRMLQYIGEDPKREGLLETPERVVKAWGTWFGGYGQDPATVLKVFEDGAEKCDEAVIVRDIDVYSHCEHHLAPIFGKCTIAYIPNGKIVGLSKLNRLVDMFARRLQVQERLTTQIADALQQHLQPKGVFVQITARHLCVESRGVKQNSTTTTTALHGVFRDEPAARAEVLASIKD